MSKAKSKSWGGVFFGLVFLLPGLAIFYFFSVQAGLRYWQSDDWVPVSAQLMSLDLHTHRGEDSDTYSVSGEYQYQYVGQRYYSDRISLSSGSDNIGSYWQDLYADLKRKDQNGRLTALVNPDDPTEAVLDRTFRWPTLAFGSLFLLMFGGAGSVIIWLSLRPSRSQRDYSKSGIPSNEKTSSRFLMWFGGFFLGIGSLVAVMVLPEELAKQNWAAMFVLIFVVVGAAVMLAGWRQSQRYQFFGATPLHLDPLEPGVGGEMGAWLIISRPELRRLNNANHGLLATLSCVRKRKSGDSTSTRVVWQDSTPVYIEMVSKGVRASFKIPIPEDLPATREYKKGEEILWEASMEGDLSSLGLKKFSRTWELVVGANSAYRSSVDIPQQFMDASEAKLQSAAVDSLHEQIPLTDNGRFLEVDSRAGRNLYTHLMLVVFGAVFIGSGWFTILQNWWPGYLFVLIGGLMFLGGLFSLGSRVHVKIDTSAHMLQVRRWLFGIPISNRECAIYRPDQFKLKRTSSVTSGKKVTEYYCLFIEYDGRKSKLAEHIKGKRAAQALKQRLEDELFA